MNNYTHELLFLKGLFKGNNRLRPLRRSWSWSTFLIILVVYFGLDLLLNVVAIIPLEFFFKDYFETYRDISDDPAFILLAGGIFAPFIEEIIFRSAMIYEKRYWSISIICISLSLFLLSWVVGLIALAGCIWLIAFKDDEYDIQSFYKKYGQQIFWGFTLIFALIHITNYDFENIPIVAYPFMVIPQLIGGILLGVIRIRYGLRYAIIHHMFFNLFVLSMELIWPDL